MHGSRRPTAKIVYCLGQIVRKLAESLSPEEHHSQYKRDDQLSLSEPVHPFNLNSSHYWGSGLQTQIRAQMLVDRINGNYAPGCSGGSGIFLKGHTTASEAGRPNLSECFATALRQ
jgi:hypothetical protein